LHPFCGSLEEHSWANRRQSSLIGAIVGAIVGGIIAAVIMFIIWLALIKHFFDCGWLMAFAIAVVAVIIFVVIVFILALIGISVIALGF
jgi:hypothetical protein